MVRSTVVIGWEVENQEDMSNKKWSQVSVCLRTLFSNSNKDKPFNIMTADIVRPLLD